MKNVFGEVDKDCNLLIKTCKAGVEALSFLKVRESVSEMMTGEEKKMFGRRSLSRLWQRHKRLVLLCQMVSSTQREDIHIISENFWCVDGHWSY